MRRKIIAGNWKMNLLLEEAIDLFEQLNVLKESKSRIIVFPSFLYLGSFYNKFQGIIEMGAQNCSQFDSGAYTGDVSSAMIKSIGVNNVLVGHSERRQYFGETNEILKVKLNRVFEQGLSPFFCCGETREIREKATHVHFVRTQILDSIGHLTPEQASQLVIAYEPVWAIGTGLNATAEEAQEMHASIRELIKERWGEEIALKIPILYGGSLKSSNALSLLTMPDIDGGLIGGASLKAEEFLSIITLANELV